MQSTTPVPTGSAVSAAPAIHPLLKIAAVSVIVASAVAIWAMTSREHSDVAAAPKPAEAVTAANPAQLANTDTSAEPARDAQPAPATKTPAPRAKKAPAERHAAAPNPPAPYQAPGAAAPVTVAAATPAPLADPTRGRIEAISMSEHKGDAKGVGAVAGGAIGGLVGNSFGKGNGKTAATVLGVVGGALAGHQIEKSARTIKTWHITTRMDDGSTRSFSQTTEPVWHTGDAIRVVDGKLARPDGSIPALPQQAAPSLDTDTRGS